MKKKSASIITIHVGRNFGSILQTLATAEVLKQHGVDTIIVNYRPPRVSVQRYFKDMLKEPSKILWRLLIFPGFYINEKIHVRFLSKYCNVSEPIYANDNFVERCPKSTYYITGSDQVWNSKYNEGVDNHYFFDGVDGPKIALSSSIGAVELTEEEKLEFLKYLSKYKAISVREKSAQDLLAQLGLKSEHLIDPTLMINHGSWINFMNRRLIPEPYIFVYVPYNIVNKSLIYQTARRIASVKGLKVITFTWTYFSDKYADKTIRFPSPGDFLSLMHYADFVITNSFHGTAFSINFNKNFYVYMPNSFSSRIQSLLNICNLSNRLLTDDIRESQISENIDYSKVNDILSNERKKVCDFLHGTL